MADTCQTCKHFQRGYWLQGMKVPDFCNRHFHAQRSDDPACKQYVKKEEADG